VQAERQALHVLSEGNWVVVSVEEPTSLALRVNYTEEALAYYDQAAQDGECYVFHQYSNEAQEDDPIH
jgi:hypothetical protein